MSDPLVLAAWLDALLSGRRVAMLGDSASGLAEQLARSSGRRVHCYDPDRARTAESLARSAPSAGQVSFATIDEAQDTHGGAFDAVIVADLGQFEEPAETLDLAQELLSARGVLALTIENASDDTASDNAVGYYELYDLLSERFEHVRMLGQAPFFGFTVADFAADPDAGITVDTSLVETNDEPTHFVALAGERPVDVDPYVLIQLPSSRGDTGVAAEQSRPTDVAALVEAKLQTSVMNTELERLRERVEEAEQIAAERRNAATQLSARLAELEAQRETERRRDRDKANAEQRDKTRLERQRTHELEGLLRATQEQLNRVRAQSEQEAQDAQETADAHQEDLDKMLERIAELEEELEAAQGPADSADAAPPSLSETLSSEDDDLMDALSLDEGSARAYQFQIDELKRSLDEARNDRDSLRSRAARVEGLETELAKLQQQQAARAQDEDGEELLAREIDTLEKRLRDRAKVIEKLHAEAREAERIGRELVREIEARQTSQRKTNGSHKAPTEAAAAPVASAGELETLLERCSRYEADLEAARWKISSLSNQIDQQSSTEVGDHAKLEQALRQAHDELAALRSQLGASE